MQMDNKLYKASDDPWFFNIKQVNLTLILHTLIMSLVCFPKCMVLKVVTTEFRTGLEDSRSEEQHPLRPYPLQLHPLVKTLFATTWLRLGKMLKVMKLQQV